MTAPPPSVEQLDRALSAVGHLIDGIRDDQWSAPTPCTDWTVRELVTHLVGVNRVMVALLNDQAPPKRGADPLGADPAGVYRDSGAAVRAVCERPGVLERTNHSPLGAATGAERLHWRIADLLAHGWDLAQATGQPAELPEDLAEQEFGLRPNPALHDAAHRAVRPRPDRRRRRTRHRSARRLPRPPSHAGR